MGRGVLTGGMKGLAQRLPSHTTVWGAAQQPEHLASCSLSRAIHAGDAGVLLIMQIPGHVFYSLFLSIFNYMSNKLIDTFIL